MATTGRTEPTPSGRSSPVRGLHDIHGNVFEWCLDFYGCYPGGLRETPQKNHVYRGGSWYCEPQYLRSASRHPGSQVRSPTDLGSHSRAGLPETVMVAPEAATPVADLEWSADATQVTVRAFSATPDAWVRFSTNGAIPGTMHSPIAPILATAGVVKASAFLACSHRSEVLEVVISQVPPPGIQVTGGRVAWLNPAPDAFLEVSFDTDSWVRADLVAAWPEHGIVRARARAPGELTSAETVLEW